VTRPETASPEHSDATDGKLASIRRILEQRAKPLSRRTQLIVTLVVVALLVVASVWAWRSARLSVSDLDWAAILIAFCVAAPATLGLKMLEYDAAARLVGMRARPRRALEVSIVSSAANLLPIPGSLLVTTHSLSEQGATYGQAAFASAIPSLAWLAIACLIGGAAVVVAGSTVVGCLLVIGGCAFLGLAGYMFLRSAPARGRPQLALRIVLIESSWVGLSGFRMWLALRAIGVSATPAQVLALAVAGAMAVAIGFLPAGLGAREALIALLSPIIKLPLSEGVVLGVVDRVIWITFLALAAVALAIWRSAHPEANEAIAAAGAGAPAASLADECAENAVEVAGERGVREVRHERGSRASGGL
jgi:uncharacterized membrane protein YbhN (UPF0104 family)